MLIYFKMAITLYMHSFSAPARSVLLTAEAIGVNLQKKVLNLAKGEHLSPEYLKLNPQHTIPTLVDNDGTVVWDSHAINAYLVGKYAKDDSLYPRDLAKRATVDQRLHFDNGAIFSWFRIVSKAVKYKGLTALTPDQIEGFSDGLEHLNNFLKASDWVAGDQITIADFCLIATVTSVNLVYPVDSGKYPNVVQWLQRAKQLPYYHVNEEGLGNLREMLKVVVK